MTQDNGTSPVRVVLADDHAIVRAGLRALLEAHPGFAVVAEAADGEEAWRRTCELRPDVLLLDLSMPVLDGAETTARVARDCPGVRILVLTMHEERSYLAHLFGLGAAGYLLKRTVAQELVRAIRVVAAGERYVDPSLANGGPSESAPPSERRADPARPHGTATEAPTERDVEVLRRVARGLTNSEIAAALGLGIAEVDAHKREGMRKLGLQSRAAVVRFAAECGW